MALLGDHPVAHAQRVSTTSSHSGRNAAPKIPGTPGSDTLTRPNDAVVSVDLFWIPLGAGTRVVRMSGVLIDAVLAFVQRRPRCTLLHSALELHAPEGRYVIEQTPETDGEGARRGVVAGGAVGMRAAGRFRIFRYEIRRWLGGVIPDAEAAVAGPVRLSTDIATVRGVLAAVPAVPTPVWGRDSFDVGEMWNSNSVIAWVLSRGGIDVAGIHPPDGCLAPGWGAGLAVALRDDTTAVHPAVDPGQSGGRSVSLSNRWAHRRGSR